LGKRGIQFSIMSSFQFRQKGCDAESARKVKKQGEKVRQKKVGGGVALASRKHGPLVGWKEGFGL